MAAFQILDAVALRDIASAEVFEKIVQDIIHVNGKGVDESYVGDRVGMASISIPKVALGEGAFRQLGATVNGGQFNALAAVNPESDYIEIPLTFVYDRIETLARVMNDKAGYALLEQKTANIRRKIARAINAITIAAQLAESLNAEYAGTNEFFTITAAQGPRDAFVAANAALGNGDEALGVDAFPHENRQALIKPSYYGSLFKTGEVILNSNRGSENLANGVLNPWRNSEASKVESRTGYCGDLVGVPMYETSPILWKLAAQYLVSGSTALEDDAFADIEGYVCSSVGTIRGFSAADNIEVVPSPLGQGWILQPLVHGGVKCVSGKSVRIIANESFVNPVTSAGTKLSILAPESRS